jgi:hypothetical protein
MWQSPKSAVCCSGRAIRRVRTSRHRPTNSRCEMQTRVHTRGLTPFLAAVTVVMGLGAASSAAAQPVLTLEGSCPGPMRAEVRGGVPNFTAHLLFARSTGSFYIRYGPCWGTTLGLSSQGLRVVASAIVDSQGQASFEGVASPGACGGYLQVFTSACQTSNVVRIP